jgi:lysozyme
MNFNLLFEELKRDEGFRSKPYRCTSGKLTIGIGRNLDDVGISETEAQFLLANDVREAAAELDRNIPWWRDMTDARQRALVNMCFNLGWPRLSLFKDLIAAMKAGDFVAAAAEALDSLWADQLDGKVDGKDGERAVRIAKMLKEG